jgi:hypothetical protein
METVNNMNMAVKIKEIFKELSSLNTIFWG